MNLIKKLVFLLLYEASVCITEFAIECKCYIFTKIHFQPNGELPFMGGGGSRNKCVELPFFGDVELLMWSLTNRWVILSSP